MAFAVGLTDDQLWSDYHFSTEKLPSLGNIDYVHSKKLFPLAERIHPARMDGDMLRRIEVPVLRQLDFHFSFLASRYSCGCGCDKEWRTTVVEQYEWKARSLTMHPIPLGGDRYGWFMPRTGEVLFQAPDEVKNSPDTFCYTVRNTNKTWFTSREGWSGRYTCAYYAATTDWYKV